MDFNIYRDFLFIRNREIMATDAIESALKKGDAKFAQLQAKTMPFYDKMEQGKFSKADLKQLKTLYLEQSKSAAKTFEECSKAIEKNAKSAVKSIVSKSIANKELLNTKELSVILNSSFSKSFQKSASTIQQVVDQTIQEQLIDINKVLTELQQQIISDHEVISHIREMLLPSFSELAKIKNPDFETLLDPKVRRRFLKAREETLADSIVGRIAKVFNQYNKLSQKKQQLSQKKKAQDLQSKDAKQPKSSFVNQIHFERYLPRFFAIQHMVSSALGVLYRIKSKLFSVRSSKAKPLAHIDLESADSSTIKNISQSSSLLTKVYSYFGLNQDKERVERFSIKRTQDQINLADKKLLLADLKNLMLDQVTPFRQMSNKLYYAMRDYYLDILSKKAKTDQDKVQLQEFIVSIKKIESERYNNDKQQRRFGKLRSIIISDVKRQWLKNIKRTANHYSAVVQRIKKSKIGSKAKKAAKIIGFAYLAALIVKTLDRYFPNWKQDTVNAVKTGLKAGFEFLGNFLIEHIPQILEGTMKFIMNNVPLILKVIKAVLVHVLKTIVDGVFSLFGIKQSDYVNEEQVKTAKEFFDSRQGQEVLSELEKVKPENIKNVRQFAQNYLGNDIQRDRIEKQYKNDASMQPLLKELRQLVKSNVFVNSADSQSNTGKASIATTTNNSTSDIASNATVDDKAVAINPIINNTANSLNKENAIVTAASNPVADSSRQAREKEKALNTISTKTLSQDPKAIASESNAINTSMPSQFKNSTQSGRAGASTQVVSPDLSLLNGGLLLNDA